MKIESVKLSEGLSHGDDRHVHNVVKKKVVEKEEQGYACKWPTSEQSLKSMEHNLNLTQLSNNPSTLSPSISSMGKRKKPNEIKDKMSPMKTRKHCRLISKHAGPDHARKFCKRKKATSNALNSPGEVKSSTILRAEEVQSSLGTKFPSFVKLMVKSHVSRGYWMRIPKPFCKSHLPKDDVIIILENESGEQFELKFIADDQGLSAGWRKFSILHKLLEGDVLVFQLTEVNKFKVYIIRANDFTEVDGVHLDAHTKKNVAGSKFSGSSDGFEVIKSIEDFKITVNRLFINSELPEPIWTKYYELCCSKNSFLHAHLVQGLNCNLVTGIIFETVNIADALRGCKLTTSRDEFVNWEKTLNSFEVVGMNVGFLRARLHRLQTLAFESENALKAERYIEAKTQHVRAENWIRDLEAKLVQLKKAPEKINADTETLESKAESYRLKFQKEVGTPWLSTYCKSSDRTL
ncbi:B3 domain-containing protein Os01g0234100-like isoform X2 [Cornus florida]|uniref:B3 domain-containing protein Os01g0234100-like isoform X2 n=1 Tax=Cornus florida TaxID=4283 RepID=UPI00289A6665|nr:B3 domain-containing protein Os01g0234100-like isoform X2 [Cornus florida]